MTRDRIREIVSTISSADVCADALYAIWQNELMEASVEAEKRALKRERQQRWRLQGVSTPSTKASQERLQSVSVDAEKTPPLVLRSDQIREERDQSAGEDNEQKSDVMDFITESGDKWTLSIPDFDKLSASFPALSPTTVHSELAKAAGWLHVNPTKRKTERGMLRFLYSWLSRAKNQEQEATSANYENQNDRYLRSPERQAFLAKMAAKYGD